MKSQFKEKHYITRSNWLRAAVLGANDGILSTASIAIGVASAGSNRDAIVLAAMAGLVAGGLSMAAGEYVSVSSQADLEQSDLEREKWELDNIPDIELNELAEIYRQRGLNKDTAWQVAQQLTAHNALEAHARDELGIMDMNAANPLQAAIASGAAFTIGGVLPLMVALFFPMTSMIYTQYGFAIVALILLGLISARTGGSNVFKAIIRITFWGTIAMGITALVGYLFNINVG